MAHRRPEHFTGRAGFGPGKKKPSFSGRENPSHGHPMGRVGPQFSGQAWAGRLRILHCKITNNILGLTRAEKKFRWLQDISSHTRPVRFVGGPGAGRAKMLKYTHRQTSSTLRLGVEWWGHFCEGDVKTEDPLPLVKKLLSGNNIKMTKGTWRVPSWWAFVASQMVFLG
jgi:hypothetical protein